MAGGEVIKELVALLRFQLESETLKKAAKAIEEFGELAAIAAGVTTAIGVAFYEAAAGTAEYATEIKKTASQIGTGVEALQALEYGAKLTGVSTEDLRSGMLGLNTVVAGLTEKSKKAGEFLAGMGVHTKGVGGAIKPTDKLLGEIADKFQKMPDGALKSATALKIFGGSGIALVPLLNKGSAGIAELTAEAEELGVILDSKTIEAAAELNDSLDRLSVIGKGLWRQLGAELVPVVQEVVDGMTAWYRANREWIKSKIHSAVELFVSVVDRGWKILKRAWEISDRFINSIGGWKAVLSTIGTLVAVALGASFLSIIGKAAFDLNKLVVGFRALSVAEIFAALPAILFGAAILALGTFLFLVSQDLVQFSSDADHSHTVLGRLVDTFDKPFTWKDSSLVTGIKILTKTLKEFVEVSIDAGKGWAALLEAFGIGTSAQTEDIGMIRKSILDRVNAPGSGFGEQAKKDINRIFGPGASLPQGHQGAPTPLTLAGDEMMRGIVGGPPPTSYISPARTRIDSVEAADRAVRFLQNNPSNITINVDGARDPTAVADEVVERMMRELDGAQPLGIDKP